MAARRSPRRWQLPSITTQPRELARPQRSASPSKLRRVAAHIPRAPRPLSFAGTGPASSAASPASYPTPLTARPPWLAGPRAVATTVSVPLRRFGSPGLPFSLSAPATSRNAQSAAMPRFSVSAPSGSAAPVQRSREDAPGLPRVLLRPRSSSTRPASIRPCLTPAFSGLATLATDAAR